MTLKTLSLALAAGLLATSSSFAQDTTGAIEGDVTDKTASAIVRARIVATNLETGFSKETTTNTDGFYRLLQLPVGRYSVTINDPQFAALVRQPIQVNVSQTWLASQTGPMAFLIQVRCASLRGPVASKSHTPPPKSAPPNTK